MYRFECIIIFWARKLTNAEWADEPCGCGSASASHPGPQQCVPSGLVDTSRRTSVDYGDFSRVFGEQ